MTVRLVPDRFYVHDEDDARRRAEEARDDRMRAFERREREHEYGSTGWHIEAA